MHIGSGMRKLAYEAYTELVTAPNSPLISLESVIEVTRVFLMFICRGLESGKFHV
jgi:hypothetical protein